MRRIYLDNAATTYTYQEVVNEMLPYFTTDFGNASSQHSYGQKAAHAVDNAREIIADAINSKYNEIYFTSGGVEADNWAIKGVAYAHKDKGNHIITTKIEHPAIMKSCEYLSKQGFEITYLSVNKEGFIDLEELKNSIKDNTILVSIMTANNEIGSIQPLKEIGKICKENKVFFHTDAVQAMGVVDIDVKEMNIDLLSMSSHKFHGPKGIGALYIRNGVRLDRYMSGGEQERAMRAGTLNTPGIVGMGKAMEITLANKEKENKYIADIRDYFVNKVIGEVPYVIYNGPKENRLPNNANFSFQYIEGESMLLNLDLEGISASSGSACSSGSLMASHVLSAIGANEIDSQGTVRFTFSTKVTKEDVDYTVEVIKKSIKRLRQMSPLFNELKGEPEYV